jgi:dihydrofolate reductase
MISIIAAVASNGVIGNEGGIPWYIPKDLKRFKELTMGHKVIMGRKTFESLSKKLEGRKIIVVSKTLGTVPENAWTLALDLQSAMGICDEDEEVFIAGGAQLYRESLKYTSKLYITDIKRGYSGDTFFPGVDWTHWELTSEEQYEQKGLIPSYSFKTFSR